MLELVQASRIFSTTRRVPYQAELLRLAIARARRVGVELQQAEQLLQDEREADQLGVTPSHSA